MSKRDLEAWNLTLASYAQTYKEYVDELKNIPADKISETDKKKLETAVKCYVEANKQNAIVSHCVSLLHKPARKKSRYVVEDVTDYAEMFKVSPQMIIDDNTNALAMVKKVVDEIVASGYTGDEKDD